MRPNQRHPPSLCNFLYLLYLCRALGLSLSLSLSLAVAVFDRFVDIPKRPDLVQPLKRPEPGRPCAFSRWCSRDASSSRS